MDEPDVHPLGNQSGLSLGHRPKQQQVTFAVVGKMRIVTFDKLIGKHTNLIKPATRGKELKGPNADVTGRNAC